MNQVCVKKKQDTPCFCVTREGVSVTAVVICISAVVNPLSESQFGSSTVRVMISGACVCVVGVMPELNLTIWI